MRGEAGTVTLEITMVIMVVILCTVMGYGAVIKATKAVVRAGQIEMMDVRDPVEFCDMLNGIGDYSELLLEGADVLIRDFVGGNSER